MRGLFSFLLLSPMNNNGDLERSPMSFRVVRMGRLIPRYTRQELETLTELIFPEELRHELTHEPWNGEGFRHYLNPVVTCLEHYMPREKPILPGALSKSG